MTVGKLVRACPPLTVTSRRTLSSVKTHWLQTILGLKLQTLSECKHKIGAVDYPPYENNGRKSACCTTQLLFVFCLFVFVCLFVNVLLYIKPILFKRKKKTIFLSARKSYPKRTKLVSPYPKRTILVVTLSKKNYASCH